jgi:alpha-tubulin suppressor-like RCC1 family protein
MNSSGQAGVRPLENVVFSPTLVEGLTPDVDALALGGAHTCALHRGGRVSCWGGNDGAQLGDGSSVDRHTPRQVPGLDRVVQLSASSQLTCALREDATVWCFGELRSEGGVRSAVPVRFEGLAGVAQVGLGPEHHCVLLTDGTARCWGSNLRGQLGDGTTIDRSTPTPVLGLTGAVELAVGASFSCARLRDGTVSCWGYNGGGTLGVGSTAEAVTTPAPVVGLRGVSRVAAGEFHACALHGDGAVACWGSRRWSQIGDGFSGIGEHQTQPSPVTVPSLVGVRRLAVGRRHSCALLGSGAAWCWGESYGGGLGTGTNQSHASPVRVLQ